MIECGRKRLDDFMRCADAMEKWLEETSHRQSSIWSFRVVYIDPLSDLKIVVAVGAMTHNYGPAFRSRLIFASAP